MRFVKFVLLIMIFASIKVLPQDANQIKQLQEKINTLETALNDIKITVDQNQVLIKELLTKISGISSDKEAKTIKNDTNTDTEKPKQEIKQVTPDDSGQCRAITKKGTRCSRKATSPNGFCWQHNK